MHMHPSSLRPLHSLCSPRALLLVVILAAGLIEPAFPQFNQSSLLSATSDKITVTNYYFARPNELTIIVNIVGHVQRPGRYEISSTIDLLSLLALAGGPTADGTLDDVTVSRVVRDSAQAEALVGNVELNDVIAMTAKSSQSIVKGDIEMMRANRLNAQVRWKKITYDLSGTRFYYAEDLQLYPGDMVMVEKSGWASFRDALAIVVPAALLTSAVAQVVSASRR